MPAAEPRRKVRRNCWVREIPAKQVSTVSAASPKACCEVASSVESVHGVEPLAEPARWDNDLDNVRKLALCGWRAPAALISEHFEHRPCALIQCARILMAIGLK
jgi:hypothetical protein